MSVRRSIWAVFVLVAAVQPLCAGLLDHFATLDPVAAEDFTGYGVGTTGTVDGPSLGGAGLGTGFSGTWSGHADFFTEDRLASGTWTDSSNNPGPSGQPYVINHTAGGVHQIARSLSTGIAKPVGGTTEFMWSFYGTSTHAYGRYGWGMALLDGSGNMLLGAGHDGNGSPAGRIRLHGPEGPNTSAPYVLAPEKRWHQVLVRGVWQEDGTADLYLYVDPTATTELGDFDTTITRVLPEDIAQLQIRAGDYNSANGLNGWDDIELRATFTEATSAIPEPATLALLACGGLGAALRRRRR